MPSKSALLCRVGVGFTHLSAAADKGQAQLFCFMTSGLALPPASGVDELGVGWGRASPTTPLPMPSHDRGIMGPILPTSQLLAWLTHTSANRNGSILLPRRGTEPILLSVVAGGRQRQLSQKMIFCS